MERFLEGFRRFRHGIFAEQRDEYEKLFRDGQKPQALIISCCDSRVDPQLILGAGPGDIFTVRNVANLVPPYEPTGVYHGTSAAIEYGVCQLEIPHLIIMGHSRCGGIRALLTSNPGQGGDFIGAWMAIAQSARDTVLATVGSDEDQAGALEQEAIRTSLANLMTFPWLRARVEAGSVKLHGLHFDLERGELRQLDAVSNRFMLVPAE